MRHDRVLELDGQNPFPAGLDDVLGAVDALDVALRRDLPDAAGAEPAVLGLLVGALAVVVATSDPRSSHLDLTKRDAIPRKLLAAGRIADSNLDSRHDHALGQTRVKLVFRLGARAGLRDAAKRRGLGHAPRVKHAQADRIHVFHQRARYGRAAANNNADQRQAPPTLL